MVGGLFETVASAAVRAGVSASRSCPIALPDEFLAAGALPTLHERYGLSTDRIVARVLARTRVTRAYGPRRHTPPGGRTIDCRQPYVDVDRPDPGRSSSPHNP